MDEVIAITRDEAALLRAALEGGLRPASAMRQACLNLAARDLLASRGPAPAARATDFALTRRGWAYLKSERAGTWLAAKSR